MRLALLYETKPEILPEDAPSDLYMELENLEDIERVADALERAGHTVLRVNSMRDPLTRLQELRGQVDLVFNYSVGFGTRSREVMAPALCGLLGIPFTGSDAMALALASDKQTTKLHAVDAAVPTPEWHRVERLADLERIGPLGFDVVVKPVYEGSSIGVQGPLPTADPASLARVVGEVLHTYRQPVLLERFIAGYELTVPVIGRVPRALHPVALRLGDTLELSTIFTAATKAESEGHGWTGDLPVGLPVRERLANFACRMHARLGCSDFSRSDFRVAPSGEVYFLEINPTSQLTDSFSAAARVEGRDLVWTVGEIVESARVRWGL